MFSKLTYRNLVTHPLNTHWTNRYNKLFKTCLSFIHGRFIPSSEMFNLGFLSPENMYKSHLLNTTYKSLYSPFFSPYLKLKIRSPSSFALKSDDHILIERPNSLNPNLFHNTFQQSSLFNPWHFRHVEFSTLQNLCPSSPFTITIEFELKHLLINWKSKTSRKVNVKQNGTICQ